MLHKLRSQVIKWDVRKVLELVLLGERTDHGATVAFLEETLEKSTDSIFLINCLAEAFLVHQGFLEILF